MPFLYPKSKKRRTLTPPKCSNYHSYKPYLQQEFSNKCVYCMRPDTFNNYNFFGVDHYRPKKEFPELTNEYSNLFYCCNNCNSFKHNYWPSAGREHLFIPNPCDHIMYEHLQFKSDVIFSKTDAGNFTVETLYLNDEEVIEFRQCLINSKKALNSQLFYLEATLKEIERIIQINKGNKLKKILLEKDNTLDDIKKTQNNIKMIEGIRDKSTTLH